jgi:hypothetical protein
MIYKSIYPILMCITFLTACTEKHQEQKIIHKASYLDEISLISQDYFKVRHEVATYYGLSWSV